MFSALQGNTAKKNLLLRDISSVIFFFFFKCHIILNTFRKYRTGEKTARQQPPNADVNEYEVLLLCDRLVNDLLHMYRIYVFNLNSFLFIF